VFFHGVVYQDPDYEDIEAEIDKELEDSEKEGSAKEERKRRRKAEAQGADHDQEQEDKEEEERWPSPMEPLEYISDHNDDSPAQRSAAVAPPPAAPAPTGASADEQTDEEKKYILDKIQQANRELRDQEPPDATRRRRLHFKEKLVDLVVPPVEYPQNSDHQQQHAPTAAAATTSSSSSSMGEQGRLAAGSAEKDRDAEAEGEVSGRLSELNISPRKDGGEQTGGSSRGADGDGLGMGRTGGDHGGDGSREGRVLVEKDGKFDLVSLKEVESHGLLPPLAKHSRDNTCSSPHPQEPSLGLKKTRTATTSSTSSPRPLSHQGTELLRAPRPPAQPRNRPSSASHSLRGSQKQGARRRVQSATGSPGPAAYSLSPQQKDILRKIQERRDRLAREVDHTTTELVVSG